MIANPSDGLRLPFRIAFRAIDAERIGACFNKRWNALFVVARIDARTDQIALMRVEEFVRIGFVALIVLTKDHIEQVIVFIDDGKRVELVIPDDIVSFLERSICRANDEVLAWRHEIRNRRVEAHARKTIVTTGDHAEQLALRTTTFSDRHGGVPAAILEFDHIG